MSVNSDLTFNQLATVLTAITAQATGTSALAVTDTSSFVTVGQTALKAGYDVLNTAISQVLSKTIFSIRPYNGKLRGMEVSEQRFGNITRKLSAIDKPVEEDNRFKLVDGQSIDPFKVDKPSVLQENFISSNIYQKRVTLYKDQLDQAFSGPSEFGSFISLVMQNASDQLEQARETIKRNTLVNLIGAILGNYAANQNIKLVTEYNAYLGLTGQNVLTWAGIKGDAEQYQRFMRFAYARIATISAMMTERSSKFHANITGKIVMRHTPADRQRMYMLGQERYDMEAQVLADAYHDNYLKYADVETVNFWQAIGTPDAINVTPSYLVLTGSSAGTVAKGSAVNKTGIFAVLMDEDACGMTNVNEWSDTIWNPDGGYSNWFFHSTGRYWNSFTENAVVFTLD
jgi:hypothetical protein